MDVSHQISTLIFALIVIGVIVYLVMSAYVVGPIAQLKQGEKVILTVGLVGIAGVILYAGAELLYRFVF